MKRVLVIFLLANCGGADTVTIPAEFFSPSVDVSQVKSFELWVFDQVGKDNTPIDCSQLEARTLFPSSPNVQVLRGPVDSDAAASLDLANLPTGNRNRVFFAEFYDQPGQLGSLIGLGCTGGQTITGGKTVTIHIAVAAPAG